MDSTEILKACNSVSTIYLNIQVGDRVCGVITGLFPVVKNVTVHGDDVHVTLQFTKKMVSGNYRDLVTIIRKGKAQCTVWRK